jgi:hypothetical protein
MPKPPQIDVLFRLERQNRRAGMNSGDRHTEPERLLTRDINQQGPQVEEPLSKIPKEPHFTSP